MSPRHSRKYRGRVRVRNHWLTSWRTLGMMCHPQYQNSPLPPPPFTSQDETSNLSPCVTLTENANDTSSCVTHCEGVMNTLILIYSPTAQNKQTNKQKKSTKKKSIGLLIGDTVVEKVATLTVFRARVMCVLILYSSIENGTLCSFPGTQVANFISKRPMSCSYIPATA